MQNESSIKKVISFIKEHYGFNVINVQPLEGYANLNFRVKDDKGNSYVFKSHQNDRDPQFFKSETRVLDQLNKCFPDQFPRPIKAKDGSFIISRENEGLLQTDRLLSWVEGDLMVNTPHSIDLFDSFGRLLAKMDKELLGMNDPIIAARHIEWDIQYFLDLRSKSKSISNPSLQKMVDYYFLQYNQSVI